MNKQFSKLVLFLILFAFFSAFVSAQDDTEKLTKILSMDPSLQKINELHQFQLNHPDSPYLGRIVQGFIITFIDMNEVDSALFQADEYIKSLPAERKGEIYNDIAYMLAENDAGLDTALVYSKRAVELVQNNPRYLSMYLDTKAYVLYKKGDAVEAVKIQKEAIKDHEDEPEYLYHLALFSKAAHNIKDALKFSALAVLHGDEGTSLVKFNEWAKDINPSLKDSIVMDIVHNFMAQVGGVNDKAVKSNAAAFMAQTGVNFKLADEWSEDAVKSINDKTLVEDYINYKKNYAIVKAADGKYKLALKELSKVETLVAPWNSDYWLTLGNVYYKLNKKNEALNAYINGLIASDNPLLLEYAKKLSSDKEIQNKIEKMKIQLSSVKHDKFKSAENQEGNVVLAELFTGAECNPCIAADRAFEELAEYFPRSALAVLEYHVHIPGPDPLTNPDTFKRYSWYGGNFGTPTIFFEGTEKITGGGPKYITANRFNVYKYIVNKYLNKKPEIKITGNVKLDMDTVSITVALKSSTITNLDPMLHIVLAEKSVKYTGANGIENNIFVVRDLVGEPSGTKLTSRNEIISRKVNINNLKKNITSYLKDPTADASWRAPSFHGWRKSINDLNKIDIKNLAVIVWVQDANTKEVLQAYYMNVN